jgi:hypothetical protein
MFAGSSTVVKQILIRSAVPGKNTINFAGLATPEGLRTSFE